MRAERFLGQVIIHKVTNEKGFDESTIHRMIITTHETTLDDVLEEIKIRINQAQVINEYQ
jgi:hypothetical protein